MIKNGSLSTHIHQTTSRIVVTTNTDGSPCSYMDDLIWDYNGMLSCAVGTSPIINFQYINRAHRLGIQTTLYQITKNKRLSFESIDSNRYMLQTISELIGSVDWNIINVEENYIKFKVALKIKQYSPRTVREIRSVINTLFDHGLTKRYISSKEMLDKYYSSNEEVKQHIAVPERMMSRLLSKAIEIIETYHPYRHAISDAYNAYYYEQKRRIDNGISTEHLGRWARNNIKHGVPLAEFNIDYAAKQAVEIQTACWIVLIGFSGIRKKEGLLMNPDSYDDSRKYNNYVIPIIHGQITKTQPTGKPKKESWITHPIVKTALELAYDMSEFSRIRYREKLGRLPSSASNIRLMHETSSAFLKLYYKENRESVIRRNIGDNIYNFAAKYNIRASSDDVIEFNLLNPTRKGQLSTGGLLPKLSNHDFRRSYAVFIMRNRFGNIMSLRAQFKHLNINMTLWYQNGSSLVAALDLQLDVELQQMVQAANQEIHENTLFYIFNDAETLSGFEGEKIIANRKAHQLDYPGQIYISREEIRNNLRNNTISVVEHPTGFCFNPDCDRICANDKSFEICKHEVITPEKAHDAKLRHQRLVKKFRSLNNDRYYLRAVLTDIYTYIKGIEKNLIAHNIPFEPFIDQIHAPSIRG